MKKVKALFAVSALVVGFLFASQTNAKADCPNGCLSNGDGCWCHAWYPCYREAGSGGRPVLQ